jgi:hypothetical protein
MPSGASEHASVNIELAFELVLYLGLASCSSGTMDIAFALQFVVM